MSEISLTPAAKTRPLGRIWQRAVAVHRPLTWFTALMAVISLLGFIGYFIDPRIVVGLPTWAKPTKFALSFVFYGATLLWMFSYVRPRPRYLTFFLHATTAILSLEMVILIVQAARARQMHFNLSTPFDAAMYATMAATIYLLFVISLVAVAIVLRQRLPGRAFAWSLRLGFALTIVAGFGLGNLMTAPTPAQVELMQTGAPEAGSFVGAHTVGAEDGGPGLPLLGWSTEHGDLRIGHFFGLHALQVIPLIGLAVTRRREPWLRESHRLVLVVIGTLAYAGWLALVTWQALRGQSIVAPDAATLTALALLIGGTLAAAGGTLAHAYARRPRLAVERARPPYGRGERPAPGFE